MTRQTLKPISVPEALAASLRQRILNGDLVPGEALPETALAAEYGVARPTIRAALQQLTTTGLLRREANRSALVPRLTEADVADLFLVRELLESEVVRLLTKRRLIPPRADQAVRRLESLAPDAHWSEVVEADLGIHRALVEATGSSRLVRLFALLEDEIRLSIAQLRPAYESPRALAREHRELLATLERGSTREALAALREHLALAIQYLGHSPAPGRARGTRRRTAQREPKLRPGSRG